MQAGEMIVRLQIRSNHTLLFVQGEPYSGLPLHRQACWNLPLLKGLPAMRATCSQDQKTPQLTGLLALAVPPASRTLQLMGLPVLAARHCTSLRQLWGLLVLAVYVV